jgi:hypothetical protein
MMNPQQRPEADPLAELLGPPDAILEADLVRDALFAQTTRVLRARRWARRGAYAATLVVCYAAGLATMLVVHRNTPHSVEVETAVDHGAGHATPDAIIPAEPDEQGSPSAEEPTETLASLTVPTRASFTFYRTAGDYQLLQQGNLQAAAWLYARALEMATPEELAISPDSDNWLLMSLKQSQLQDSRHVHDEG